LEQRIRLLEARVDTLEWSDFAVRSDRMDRRIVQLEFLVNKLWDWIPFLQQTYDWLKGTPRVAETWESSGVNAESAMDP
jgi:hypothetical protein